MVSTRKNIAYFFEWTFSLQKILVHKIFSYGEVKNDDMLYFLLYVFQIAEFFSKNHRWRAEFVVTYLTTVIYDILKIASTQNNNVLKSLFITYENRRLVKVDKKLPIYRQHNRP